MWRTSCLLLVAMFLSFSTPSALRSEVSLPKLVFDPLGSVEEMIDKLTARMKDIVDHAGNVGIDVLTAFRKNSQILIGNIKVAFAEERDATFDSLSE